MLWGFPKTLIFNLYYFGFNGLFFPVYISPRVVIKNLKGNIYLRTKIKSGLIKIGFNDVSITSLWDRSIWNVKGTIIFFGRAKLGSGTSIFVNDNSKLIIGDNFLITARSNIICNKEIHLGSNCLLSWDILIMDTDAHPVKDKNKIIINKDQKIHIGNNVWIGCNVIILKGSIISNNCIVGAGSFINKIFYKENTIIAGNPAKIVKKDIIWEGGNF